MKKIAVYGAGKYARMTLAQLISTKHKIDCFVVSQIKNNPETCFGIPVKEITDIYDKRDEYCIILGVSMAYYNEILSVLKLYDFNDIFIPCIQPMNYKLFSWMGHREYIELWYYVQTGKYLNLDNPTTFNEKIQWSKLYDTTPLKTTCADKYAVRSYVKEKVGEDILIPLLGSWESFESIDFSKLPNEFVLKCNHGCGFNEFVHNKNEVNMDFLKKKFDDWMKIDYSEVFGLELQYHSIKHKIVAETYLKTDGIIGLLDYKFFVFNGSVKLIQVDIDRYKSHKRNLYSPNWEELFVEIQYPSDASKVIKKPEKLEEMKLIAETLGKEFSHVRVDLYLCNDKIYFGEMTFTHGSGIEDFRPKEFETELGNLWRLPIDADNTI